MCIGSGYVNIWVMGGGSKQVGILETGRRRREGEAGRRKSKSKSITLLALLLSQELCSCFLDEEVKVKVVVDQIKIHPHEFTAWFGSIWSEQKSSD